MISDLEARLLTWMKPCPTVALVTDQHPSAWAGCSACGGTGQMPVLLGVTVERCQNPFHTSGHEVRGFNDCPKCLGERYVWVRENAVESLLKWLETEGHPWEATTWGVSWPTIHVHLVRMEQPFVHIGGTKGAGPTFYEALLRAVDALRKEAK